MKVRELLAELLDQDMDADVAYNDSEGGTLPVDGVCAEWMTPVLNCRSEPVMYDPRPSNADAAERSGADIRRVLMLLP
ncbi:hypothetical protein SEA_PHINKBODEN_13 [Gordonia Phage PhinkBoden]|nr:hypothetical protein SEA_PHINKBODEN_13 [Gordonia Phage PhinkBoden]